MRKSVILANDIGCLNCAVEKTFNRGENKVSVGCWEAAYRNDYVRLVSQGLKNVSSVHKRLITIQSFTVA